MLKKQKIILFLAISLISLGFVLGGAKETRGASKKDCAWEFVCNIYWCMEGTQVCACGNLGGDCYRPGCGGPAGEYPADIVQDNCTGQQVCNNLYHPISPPQCHYISSWSACPNPSPNWSTKPFISWDDCQDASMQCCPSCGDPANVCQGISYEDSCGNKNACMGTKICCVDNHGDSCSATNDCGQTNSGTVPCEGGCDVSAPPNPPGYGDPCMSEVNFCGQTYGGTIQCDGSCSAKREDICNNSSCVSISAPDSITSGQQFDASIIMKNTGNKIWKSDATPHKLGSENTADNERWGFKRVSLPSNTNPESSVTFNFTATAPATANSYPFSWKMIEDGIEWFGEICTKNIKVIPLPTVTLKATPTSISTAQNPKDATLTWTVANADGGGCWGWSDNGDEWEGGKSSGSLNTDKVSPEKSTKYFIECWNALGNKSNPASASVCVSDCACRSETCYDEKCSECGGSFECNGIIPSNTKGPWGECSKNCGGGGIQKRQVFCPDGIETQNCNSQPCPPGYREVAP